MINIKGFLEWLALDGYIFKPNKMNIVGLIWLIILFIFSFNKLKKDLGETNNYKKLFRICCVSFLLSYFIHIFYDLWAFAITFNVYNHVPIHVMMGRLSRNLLQFTVLFYIFSSPDWSRDFPSLHKIKMLGNKKFIALNIVILVWHFLLLYYGFLDPLFYTNKVTRFYVGYVPVKTLMALSYWSIWK